jgi:hypothetical protein
MAHQITHPVVNLSFSKKAVDLETCPKCFLLFTPKADQLYTVSMLPSINDQFNFNFRFDSFQMKQLLNMSTED